MCESCLISLVLTLLVFAYLFLAYFAYTCLHLLLLYLALQGQAGPYWILGLLGLTRPYWALLGLTALLGLIGLGLYWALLGLTGPYWALLGLKGPYF